MIHQSLEASHLEHASTLYSRYLLVFGNISEQFLNQLCARKEYDASICHCLLHIYDVALHLPAYTFN